jgi:hypothetical protein
MGNIFSLTKREQRVVIIIVLALLSGTMASHFRTLRSKVPAPPAVTATPSPADTDETAGGDNPSP